MGATSLDLSQIKTDVLSAASTFRTLIGLGNVNNTADLDKPISTATQVALTVLDVAKLNTSDFTFANLGSKPTTLSGYGITDAQPVNANLTEIAALTTQPYGRSLLTQADAGAARTTLGLGTLATQNGTISDYLLSTTAASTYLPLAGGTLTGRLTTPSLLLSGNFSSTAWTTNGVGIAHTARTLTDTSSTGTVAAAYTNVLGGNTIAASNATTYTDYASLFLGNPTAGTNVSITNSFSLITAGAARFGGDVTIGGNLTITQPVSTSGSPTAFSLTGGAHTTLSASTEAVDINLNLARSVQFSTGALTTQRAVRIQAPTYTFVGASTITNASTLAISGAPIAGTNATITNPWALNVESGSVKLSGQVLALSGARIYLWNTASYYFEKNNSLSTSPVSTEHVQIALDHSGGSYISGFFCNEALDSAFGWSDNSTNAKRTRICSDGLYTVALRNTTNSFSFRVYNTFTNTSNYIRQSLSFTTYSATVHAQWVAEGLGTGAVNIPIVISPRGTGALISGPMPDGTSTGGNARGNYAIDLQSNLRSSAAQVASGLYAVAIGTRNQANGEDAVAIGLDNIAGGYDTVCIGKGNNSGFGGIAIGWMNSASLTGIGIGQANSANGDTAVGIGSSNTASGQYANAIGRQNTASATRSTAIGTNARSNRYGMYSYSAGMFSTAGDAQNALFIARARTTDATPTILTLDGSTTRLTITTGEVLGFVINVTGSKSDGTAIAHYVRKGAIKRVSNTTTLAYVETVGTDYEDNAATDIAITADDANDALQISVTGIAGETWRWVATIEAADLGFGT